MTQHSALGLERWQAFGPDQQLLMVANEMHRASKLLDPPDRDRLRLAHERVLRLADLTIQAAARPSLRRELLRWRDLVAELYISPAPDRAAHASALRALLLLHPAAARQVGLLAPGAR